MLTGYLNVSDKDFPEDYINVVSQVAQTYVNFHHVTYVSSGIKVAFTEKPIH
jgi:hypothetical protein